MRREDLHNYQTRAIDFIKDNTHCGCLLDMGLGKSVITLTAIKDLIDDLDITKVLVVAPKKVAETTWTDEAEKWDHLSSLRVSKVMGTEKKRTDALNEEADIYVIGRDSFVWLVKYYRGRLPFDMIVLDELTSFKSNKSQRFKAFRLIRSQPDRIIGLTGTPAPNGYQDLWAQIYCLDGGHRLGTGITKFREKYFDQVMSRQGYALKMSLKQGAKDAIDGLISDICIAMKAEDYITLPPRQDIVQRVALPDAIKKKYADFERNMVMDLKKDGQITASSAAALMGKLLQFCNGAVYDEDHGVHEIHDEKLQALVEIYEAAQSPLLVFYQFIHDKERICKALSAHTSSIRIYKDEHDLRDWNDGKIDILLAHPASCSYGLNLQKGGHICVWFGTGFNLEQYQQANARLYRQGQKMPVMIYNIICSGTVDERAMRALQGKSGTQDSLMNAVKELMKKYENRD